MHVKLPKIELAHFLRRAVCAFGIQKKASPSFMSLLMSDRTKPVMVDTQTNNVPLHRTTIGMMVYQLI